MSEPPQRRLIRLRWVDPISGSPRVYTGFLPVSIGRLSDNAIQLKGERISREHVLLYQEDGAIVIQDQQSTNGTQLNGWPIQQATLSDGDQIAVGDYRLILELDEASELPPAPEPPRRLEIGWLDATNRPRKKNLPLPITVGRSGLNDVLLASPSVSREHAVIMRNDRGIRVLDRGSANGIRLNGAVCREGWLQDGDELAVGRYRLRISFPPPGSDEATLDQALDPSEAQTTVVESGQRDGGQAA